MYRILRRDFATAEVRGEIRRAGVQFKPSGGQFFKRLLLVRGPFGLREQLEDPRIDLRQSIVDLLLLVQINFKFVAAASRCALIARSRTGRALSRTRQKAVLYSPVDSCQLRRA